MQSCFIPLSTTSDSWVTVALGGDRRQTVSPALHAGRCRGIFRSNTGTRIWIHAQLISIVFTTNSFSSGQISSNSSCTDDPSLASRSIRHFCYIQGSAAGLRRHARKLECEMLRWPRQETGCPSWKCGSTNDRNRVQRLGWTYAWHYRGTETILAVLNDLMAWLGGI